MGGVCFKGGLYPAGVPRQKLCARSRCEGFGTLRSPLSTCWLLPANAHVRRKWTARLDVHVARTRDQSDCHIRMESGSPHCCGGMRAADSQLRHLLHFELPLTRDNYEGFGRWIGQRDDIAHLVHGAASFE